MQPVGVLAYSPDWPNPNHQRCNPNGRGYANLIANIVTCHGQGGIS
jgi:hypothetical protein